MTSSSSHVITECRLVDEEELVPPFNSYVNRYTDPHSDEEPEAQVLYVMPPCMDRSGMPPGTEVKNEVSNPSTCMHDSSCL